MKQILRLPLIPTLIAYTLGLYSGHFNLRFPLQGVLFLLLILLILWVFLMVLKKTVWGSWIAFVLFFLLGIFSIHTYLYPQHSSSHISQYIGYDRISLEGIVDRSPERTQGRTHLWIRSEKVISPKHHIPVDGYLLLILKKESGTFRLGDRLRFSCKLYSPHGFHNPGGFSYERHLAFDRIHTIGFLADETSWVKIGEGFKNPILLQIESVRDHIRNFLEKEAHPPSSSIFKALVLGEQGDLPEEVKENFILTGTAHLLAISGDQFGIVAFLSFSLLIWLLKRSEYILLSLSVRKWAAGLTIPCIILYAFIAGGGMSVIRAMIMLITFLLSILLNRERNLLHTLALAAFFILLFSPPSLFDVSFQLSFLAVFSILYLVPRILEGLKKEGPPLSLKGIWGKNIWRYIKLSFLVTAVATFGTAPLVALHFNRISPIGLVTNLFVIPWVGFLIVPISLTASILSFVFYPFAGLFIHINQFFTGILLQTVAFFASLPFASFFISTPTTFEIILFYVLLFSAVHLRKANRVGTNRNDSVGTTAVPARTDTVVPTHDHGKKRVRYLFLGASLLLILDLAFWNGRGYFQKNLTLTFIDVGHGDSILLEFPKGKKMLIDGGGLYEDRFDIGKNVIAPFLWKKKIRRIDFLVLTHPDPDHLKGLNFIASHFSIGQFWDNGFRTDSEPFQRLEETLLRKSINRLSLNENSPPQVLHGVQISFFNPPGKSQSYINLPAPSLQNNSTLVMMIQFKDIRILLSGDIEKEAEYRMLREGYSLQADILKIPHHGSSSSSTPSFLQSIKPSYAILSVGERNIGKLPHPEVMKRYQQLGVKIYRTDKDGAITVATDGKKIDVKPFLKN